MRHEAEHVAGFVADAGDVAGRAVWVIHVAQEHLFVRLEFVERPLIGVVVALAVRDGDTQPFARALEPQVHVPADEFERAVAHQSARQEPRLAEDLEAVADADDSLAGGRVLLHGIHDGREARDGAGPQVVAVAETARQDDAVHPFEIALLVPDGLGGLFEDYLKDVLAVVVAVGPGENHYTKLQESLALMTNDKIQMTNEI